MCQTTVTNVFPHADSHFINIIFTTSQSSQCLPDYNLGRETDIVVYVLFAETNRLFPADFQRYSTKPLFRHSCRHNTAERMRCIRNQYNFFTDNLFCKFHWIRIIQFLHWQFILTAMTMFGSFHKGTYTNTQRTSRLTLIQLQNQWIFAADMIHQTDNLVRQICIMAAAETYHLGIFQMWASCCQNR